MPKYTWQAGDTFTTVALKYRQSGKYAWKVLFDLNKNLVVNQKYLMHEGDVIDIPEEWMNTPPPEREVKIVGTRGRVIVGDGR